MNSIYYDEDDLAIASEEEKQLITKTKQMVDNLRKRSKESEEAEKNKAEENYKTNVMRLKASEEYTQWLDLSNKIGEMHTAIMKVVSEQDVLERSLSEKYSIKQEPRHYMYGIEDPFPHFTHQLWNEPFFNRRYKKKNLPPLREYHQELYEMAKRNVLFEISEKMKHREVIHETYDDRICSKKIQKYLGMEGIEQEVTAKK